MAETAEKTMRKFLSSEIHGWKAERKAETYSRETIYDYMDGAGEIYLAYNFKELLVQRYVKTRAPEIIVEVFDMGSGEDAFGVFSYGQGREKGEIGIGQDSEYRGGLLCFWKDRFFICIRTERETPSAKRAVLALGRAISKAIRTKGEKPAILNYLSEDEFLEKSLRYFHNYAILNYHYFVADKNILNLDESTKAILARYKDGKGYLLLVQYQDTEEAKTAFEGFINAYMPDARGSGVIQTENGKWTGAKLEKNFVIILFDALSKAQASSKIEVVRNRLR
ncbi:MAG: hypothetical protein HZA07_00855 [Nitrospirae bacterium]|nr:hypothetical protein [Nitrospirota bacterium]